MVEILLDDPGLVENAEDGMSCFHACVQMIMRTQKTAEVFSFADIDKILRRKPGKYSWEYAVLTELVKRKFDVKLIQTFNLERFIDNPEDYLIEYFGEEAGKNQIENSQLDEVIEDAKNFLSSGCEVVQNRVPNLEDVRDLLKEGYFLIPIINQKILQSDPGYVAHSIVLFGFSNRGVRFHNPGPPATRASEIDWTLFEKAWSSPSESARSLIAVRP